MTSLCRLCVPSLIARGRKKSNCLIRYRWKIFNVHISACTTIMAKYFTQMSINKWEFISLCRDKRNTKGYYLITANILSHLLFISGVFAALGTSHSRTLSVDHTERNRPTTGYTFDRHNMNRQTPAQKSNDNREKDGSPDHSLNGPFAMHMQCAHRYHENASIDTKPPIFVLEYTDREDK